MNENTLCQTIFSCMLPSVLTVFFVISRAAIFCLVWKKVDFTEKLITKYITVISWDTLWKYPWFIQDGMWVKQFKHLTTVCYFRKLLYGKKTPGKFIHKQFPPRQVLLGQLVPKKIIPQTTASTRKCSRVGIVLEQIVQEGWMSGGELTSRKFIPERDVQRYVVRRGGGGCCWGTYHHILISIRNWNF